MQYPLLTLQPLGLRYIHCQISLQQLFVQCLITNVYVVIQGLINESMIRGVPSRLMNSKSSFPPMELFQAQHKFRIPKKTQFLSVSIRLLATCFVPATSQIPFGLTCSQQWRLLFMKHSIPLFKPLHASLFTEGPYRIIKVHMNDTVIIQCGTYAETIDICHLLPFIPPSSTPLDVGGGGLCPRYFYKNLHGSIEHPIYLKIRSKCTQTSV
jgi:hypothetical protein